MSDIYKAWDGHDYPWPPPDGWGLRSDGRYWPSPEGPGAPDPTPQPAMTPPPPLEAPPFQPSLPGPGGPSPMTGPPGDGKGSNTTMVVLLTLFVVLVLLVGGCVASFAFIFNTADNALEELEETAQEFEQNQIEARGEVSIVEGSCRLSEGFPKATVRVENRSGGRSDYDVTVFFSDNTGRRVATGFTDIDSVDDGDTTLVDVLSFEADVSGPIECNLGDVTRTSSNLGFGD